MSTKDNWDDSSDEEGDAPPDPLIMNSTTEPLYEAKEEYHITEEANENDYTDEEEADPIDEEEKSIKKVDSTNYESEEEYEEDYDDDYDDEIDKKLGRYVSCR
jgi:hypothetical protein